MIRGRRRAFYRLRNVAADWSDVLIGLAILGMAAVWLLG
jgi:hypothetical protein